MEKSSKSSTIEISQKEFIVIISIIGLLLLYILIIFSTFDSPTATTLLINNIINGTTIAVVALGFSLIFGVAKQLKLSVGGYFAISAYFMFFLLETVNLSIESLFSIDGILNLGLILLPVLLSAVSLIFLATKLDKKNKNRFVLMLLAIIISLVVTGIGVWILSENIVQAFYSILAIAALSIVAWYFDLTDTQIALGTMFASVSLVGIGFLAPLLGFQVPVAYLTLLILVIVITAGLAMLEDRYLLDKVRKSQVNVLIITFAVALILQSVIQIFYFPKGGSFEQFGPETRNLTGIVSKSDRIMIPFLGVEILTIKLIALIFSITAMILLYFFIWRTKMGMAIRAVAQDEEAAAIVGINIRKITAIVSGVGMGLVGLASALVSPYQATPFWSPFMGWFELIQVIAVVTLGGLGSLAGTVIAAFILAFTRGLVGVFEPDLLVMIPFIIVFLVLILRPQGILGSKKELETVEL